MTMQSAKPVLLTLLLGIPLLAAGCTTPVTFNSWQDRVEEYVWKEASGDPNVLRDTTWAGSQKGFSVIGHSLPESSTDANGLLLGHRQVEGRNWFIFLVGLVEKQVVQDIRLAALSVDAGEFQWISTHQNPVALSAYRQYREREWKTLYPGREEPPAWYLRFPDESDAFDLSIDVYRVIARHRQSGALWSLRLPHPRLAQSWSTDARSVSLNE